MKDLLNRLEEKTTGRFVATKMHPSKGVEYIVVSKDDATKIKKHKGGMPHPDGWMSLYFVSEPSGKSDSLAIKEVKRGLVDPVWDWGSGVIRKGH